MPGVQIVQLFDSWAHHLSPEQFMEFSQPYAERIIAAVRAKYPHVPLIFHANGGTGKLRQMAGSSADVLGLDWACTMADARQALGADRTLQVKHAEQGCRRAVQGFPAAGMARLDAAGKEGAATSQPGANIKHHVSVLCTA